ncbi:solute carrier family 35 member G1 isoform X2 [Hoplias malabaricus]|uniref:solute carrier family 35 member G1 isoform X2 n=1 Tax=Hoplias malabaricus TaxID=27720 RepID=UPI003461ED3A
MGDLRTGPVSEAASGADPVLSVVPCREGRERDELDEAAVVLGHEADVVFRVSEDGEGDLGYRPRLKPRPAGFLSGRLSPLRSCCSGAIAEDKEQTPQKEKKSQCPGQGLMYALLASVFFSFAALLVKKIDGMHAVEISAIRCFFQMLFVVPAMIYYRTGFLGPHGMRLYLLLRGLLGSNAMILLYYAVIQMPLADATVITFSNPVFTALLAWVFLNERCTVWDVVFTIFTLTGVILIARPPFLFGGELTGIEGNYSNHIKGTVAAFAGAIGAACTMVILRKMGKNVHYCLSIWYYAVLGLIECTVALFILDEWTVPSCSCDRWSLVAIGLLGIAGQMFLTKALQIENAGPVALMRTMDVVLAFILQFFFLNLTPTWWSLGGALCVISSTSGVVLRKWYNSSRQKT